MVAALLPIGIAAAGGLVVVAVLRRHGWGVLPSAAWALALAPGVGFGLLSLAFFFLAFAGFSPPGRWLLIGSSAVLAAVIAMPVVSGVVGGGVRRTAARAESSPARPEFCYGLLGLLLLLGISLGLLLWTFPQVSKALPFGSWDAWAIWNVRSLFLFRAGDDLAQIYSRPTLGHPDYPLLLPASLAAQYCLLGSQHLAIPMVTGLLFALASGVVLFLTLWRYASAAAAAAAVAVLWSTPAFWRWAFAQYADLPLAYLLLAAAAALASQLDDDRSRRLPPVLAGFCFGLLAWIKNEGLVLALLLAAAFAAGLIARPFGATTPRGSGPGAADRRETLRRLPWIAAGALPPWVALGLFKSFWSPTNETAMFLDGAAAKLLSFERWRTVVTAFFEKLNPWSGIAAWGLLWPLVALCAVVFWRRRLAAGRPLLVLGGVLILAWAAWLVVYVCTPMDLDWHLDSSLDRLLLQLTPLTLAWALCGAGRAREAPEIARSDSAA